MYQRIMCFLLWHLGKSIATAKIHNNSESAKKYCRVESGQWKVKGENEKYGDSGR